MECQCLNTFPTDKHGVTEGVNGRCAKKVSRGEKALKEGGSRKMQIRKKELEMTGESLQVACSFLLTIL